MPKLKNSQYKLNSQRKELAEASLALQKAKAQLEQLNSRANAEIKFLDPQGRLMKLDFFNNAREKINNEISRLAKKVNVLKGQIAELSNNTFFQIDPTKIIEELNDQYPILMFPLRLETRFKKTGDQNQLWLRVYPDDCNINKMELLLTEQELENAKSFWIEMWKAGGIEEERMGAWRSLVNSHGSGRAAWIIKQYEPKNEPPKKADSSYAVLTFISSQVLSEEEEKAVKKFWASFWLAKDDQAKQNQSLDELKSDLNIDESSAKNLKDQFTPVNLDDEIPADIGFDKVIVARLDLPSSEEYTTTQNSWNQAPKAVALPDKFVAIAYSGNSKKTFQFERPVKEDLPVGPDPSLDKDEQIHKNETKDIILNDELKWMVDFDKAVEVGMATKINLTSQEADGGFDKLFVIGLRFSSNETSGAEVLEKLIQHHYYSKEGFSLVRQGTPTNNTEDAPSGYSWLDNAEESYKLIFPTSEDREELSTNWPLTDGQKLAECLGIDPEILKNVSNSNGRDQLKANAMNTALFPATLGYFMEEMMNPLFSNGDIEATKIFFAKYVSGRGPLPAIRIGKQPYGILPVSVYSKLAFHEKSGPSMKHGLGDTKTPFLSKLHGLIMKLDAMWDQMVPEVSHIGKAGDSHQILLDVLGLHANSVEFHQRYAQSISQIYNQINMQTGLMFAGIVSTALINRGKVILRELGLDVDKLKLPIVEKYFLSEANLLYGPLVDNVPSSETDPIRPYIISDDKEFNYIQWLVASDGNTVRLQDFGENPAPNALLYLLLRHALLQSQAKSATNLLISNEIVPDKRIFFDKEFLHIQKEDAGKSKFEHLYKSYPEITGSQDMPLIHYIYQPNIRNELPETKDLEQTLKALEMLEKTSTASLERLLVEHIDCCNYRIDAWKTGLVQSKLLEQRQSNQQERAIYLGAYGWLLEVRPKLSENTNLGYIHAPSIDQAATAAILRNAYDSNKGNGSTNPFAINLTSERIRIANSFLEGMRNGQSLSALLGYQFERGLHDKYGLGLGEADEFIYPLRKAFPLVGGKLNDTSTTNADTNDAVDSNNLSDDSRVIETIEANNVIDGLKLIQHVQDSSTKTYPFGLPAKFKLPSASATQSKAITDEVERLIEIHDAIGDLVMSEQVYQVVKGNFDRAAGVADAFSKGSYPPNMEVINTPRSGTALTHRMSIHFNAEADPNTSPNSLSEMTPRAKAEPGINEWLSEILPDPSKVQCKVIYSTPVEQNTLVIISQRDLSLQPIDLLYSATLDSEQGMTELDDRIMNYVRYTISKHPATEIFIKYTDSIDGADKSIITFFELGAIIQSLRKVLLGNKYLKPTSFGLPTGEQLIIDNYEVDDLIDRVSTLKSGLGEVRSNIKTKLDGMVSIASLKAKLEEKLSPHIADTSKKESIINQFGMDLKSYITDLSSINKNKIISNFESEITFLAENVKNNLKTDYADYLDQYQSDFVKLDEQIKGTSEQFMQAAFYDSNQTGIGFLHQGIAAVYKNVFDKLDAVISRWETKNSDFEILMAPYEAATEQDQYSILQKAERIISSQSTFPLPNLNKYKNDIDDQKGKFDNILDELKSLKTNSRETITEFLADAETVTRKIGDHDVIAFDIDNNRNDLYQQKLILVSLKENVATAMRNEENYISNKIVQCENFLMEADSAVSKIEKVDKLLKATRSILGEETLLLPKFTLSDDKTVELENAYKASESILDFVKSRENRVFPVEDWFTGIARVREKVHHFENITLLAPGFKAGNFIDLTPLQFPFKEKDRWLAMKFKDQDEILDTLNINGDKLLYTAHFAREFEASKPICGIVFDEWTEVIPAKEETTGIAFHYDQPNSEPPQTMFLMVPPVINGKWEWEDIVQSLEETLEMAKKRAIEPSMIEKTNNAQFLPTTMMAVTASLITVATNLALNNKDVIKNENG